MNRRIGINPKTNRRILLIEFNRFIIQNNQPHKLQKNILCKTLLRVTSN
ncbi:hypothetical protein LEP1GSC187_2771 [Leptospira santarosai str. ZUN179]|uniref:Uncharacterized protein n=1 Tax=Leptospira santarosai str. ZUN179 TaxID=1049985 RepID=M6UFV9_9LEPT|nr:hypothetical protein LEP1GSC187_2771 [Leptospira santarosai str. ZUN179]